MFEATWRKHQLLRSEEALTICCFGAAAPPNGHDSLLSKHAESVADNDDNCNNNKESDMDASKTSSRAPIDKNTVADGFSCLFF